MSFRIKNTKPLSSFPTAKNSTILPNYLPPFIILNKVNPWHIEDLASDIQK